MHCFAYITFTHVLVVHDIYNQKVKLYGNNQHHQPTTPAKKKNCMVNGLLFKA